MNQPWTWTFDYKWSLIYLNNYNNVQTSKNGYISYKILLTKLFTVNFVERKFSKLKFIKSYKMITWISFYQLKKRWEQKLNIKYLEHEIDIHNNNPTRPPPYEKKKKKDPKPYNYEIVTEKMGIVLVMRQGEVHWTLEWTRLEWRRPIWLRAKHMESIPNRKSLQNCFNIANSSTIGGQLKLKATD